MIFNTILLFSMFNLILVSSSSSNWRNSHKIRNISFKIVIFKEKTAPKLLNYFNEQYQKIYDKAFLTIVDSINEYENLSHDDKYLIDFIFGIFIG